VSTGHAACGNLRSTVIATAPFVLVHSPLLGPSAWEWVGRELEQRGRAAVVPSLLGVAHEPYPTWREACEAVAAASAKRARTVVLVGHSGAGSLLPAMAGRLSGGVAAMVFVDAFLPPPSGTAHLIPAEFIEELNELVS
jgi:pimeloyl-ACP methyl ester carboxylesterase